jgi:hypothetical protein
VARQGHLAGDGQVPRVLLLLATLALLPLLAAVARGGAAAVRAGAAAVAARRRPRRPRGAALRLQPRQRGGLLGGGVLLQLAPALLRALRLGALQRAAAEGRGQVRAELRRDAVVFVFVLLLLFGRRIAGEGVGPGVRGAGSAANVCGVDDHRAVVFVVAAAARRRRGGAAAPAGVLLLVLVAHGGLRAGGWHGRER